MPVPLPTTREALLEALSEGSSFEYLPFWGHRRNAEHGADKSCLSQWYPASFAVNGARYATAEHWMMAEKARLFGDDAMLDAILASTDPSEAKAYGRKVSGYDDAAWAAHRFDAVVEGNVHKFEQNPTLRAFLVNTGNRVLVEAAPRDTIWGVGRGAEKAVDPHQWRGLNLLGFALMIVRERLRGAGRGTVRTY